MGIFKQYKAGTLDLISSDYTRPEANASEMRNVLFTGSVEDPAIQKRPGMKRRAALAPEHGLVEFERRRPTDDVLESELLGFFADGLKRRKEASIEITYSGSAAVATLTLWYNPTSADFRCLIVEDGVTTYNGDLGLGYDEGSPFTISDLDTAISALTGFAATVTGTGTIPAAFLENVYLHDLKAGSCTLKAYEWEDIYDASGSSFTTLPNILIAWADQPEYEPISSTSLNYCLYFYYNGALKKYDGQNVFDAGVAKNGAPLLSAAASGSIPAGTYQYITRGKMRDSAGNIIYGPWSDPTSITLVATRDVNITTSMANPALLKSTRCDSTMGSPSTTIPVAADVFEVNDLVVVWDRALGELVYSRVQSVGSGTITISQAVQLINNDAVTLGYTVEVARTKAGGANFYFVDEKPADWLSPAPNLLDNTLDSALTEEVVLPEFDFGQAPAGNYVAKYQGGLVVSGFPLTGRNRLVRRGSYGNRTYDYGLSNEVAFADYENFEGFPTDGSFTVNVESDQGDTIRGMQEIGNSLFVFKDRSIARLAGDPTALDIRLDWQSKEVGCLAGHTIKEVNGQVIFLSTRGFASVTESTVPNEKLGYVIRPIINNLNKDFDERLQFLAGSTDLLESKQLYLCYLPAWVDEADWVEESNIPVDINLGDGADVTIDAMKPYESGNGRLFVYDYLRGRWSEWKINAAAGLCEYQDRLVIADRRYSSLATDVVSGLFEENIENTGIMYQDHDAAISFRYGTSWYTLNKPSVYKQYPRVRVSSIPSTTNSEATLDVREQVNFIRSDFAEVGVSLGIQASPFQVVAQSRLGDGKFRAIRLILENEEHNKNVEIEGWELEVDASYIEELKT